MRKSLTVLTLPVAQCRKVSTTADPEQFGNQVMVGLMGEFSRTPRINGNAGRDHWGQAQSILVAGGGYRHGQIIGATNSKAEHPIERPVGPLDLCAIVYNALQLDPAQLTVTLPDGRPMHLAQGGRVPPELV